MRAEFDLYVSGETGRFFERRPLLAPATLAKDAEVWMDGNDGFFDQYSDPCRFTLLESGISSIPREPDLFENLPFVEVEILENRETCARVFIRQVQMLREWARSVVFACRPSALGVGATLLARPGRYECDLYFFTSKVVNKFQSI